MRYTARELAELRLPGLPSRPHKVRAMAARQGWGYTEQTGRGGTRRLYAVASLPEAAQAALIARQAAPVVTTPPETSAPDAPESHWAIAGERARACVIAADLIDRGTPRAAAYRAAATQAQGASARSVRRWLSAVASAPRHEWARLLLPAWQSRTERAECHPEAWAFFVADYLRASAPPFTSCYRRTVDVAKGKRWTPVPSLTAMRRRLQAEIPRAVIVAAREGTEVLERLYPAQERDKRHLMALEAVNADGHKFDVMVRWPDGSVCRPVLLGFQDLASGKILSWRVDRTEHGDLVRLAFGDMIEQWGIPRAIYLDNGRGFANKWFTGRSEWRFRFKVRPEEPIGLLKQLGVDVRWVTPYHGQAKPIERAWRDLCTEIARHPLCEGAYTGSDPTRKPHNYGSHVVELEDFLRVVEVAIREHNARKGRLAKICGGKSFDQVFAASYAQATIRRVTDAQRRLLMLAAERIRVRKGSGCVHLIGNRYWAPGLVQYEGQDVVLRFDPSHAKRGVYVYELGGKYICHAECIAAVGFDDRTAARDHAQARKAFIKAQQQALKAERQFTAAELGEMHLAAQGAAKSAPKPAAKVTRLVPSVPSVPRVEPTPAETERRERTDDLILAAGRAARAALARRATG